MTAGPACAEGARGQSYGHLAVEYDDLLGPLALQTWRQGILLELLRLDPPIGAVVVDLGAGTGVGGRLLGAVLDRPHRVGVDRSAAMLERSGAHYEQQILVELTDLELSAGSVTVATAGFDTLNYLPEPDLGLCLRRVGTALQPGGWLIFDYSSPWLLQVQWREHNHVDRLADGASLHWRHRYDACRQRGVTDLFRLDGTGAVLWRETHVQYAYDAYQIAAAAAEAGLRVEGVRDLDRAVFSPNARTHVWLLRKD